MIPSSRPMLSRDKRLPLDTRNTSGLQEMFLAINFLRLIHPEIIIKKFTLAHHKGNEDQFHKLQGRGHLSQEMTNKVKAQFQCRHCARRPSTMSSFLPEELPQNSMVGPQRQQISELQFEKFPAPRSFLVWKIRCKNQATACSDIPSEAMLWIKEVEMVARGMGPQGMPSTGGGGLVRVPNLRVCKHLVRLRAN